MLRRVRKQKTPHAACAFECVLRVGVYVSVRGIVVVVVGAGVGRGTVWYHTVGEGGDGGRGGIIAYEKPL